MIKVAICDTDKEFVKDLIVLIRREALKKNIECLISEFMDSKGLMNSLETGLRFDVVFLETHIGEECGVALGKDIKSFDKKIDLIYFSYTRKYTLDCFDIGAFNYILKPLVGENKRRFLVQFERLLIRYYMNRGDFLNIKESKGGIRLPINKILYIETTGKLIRIHYDKNFVDVHERMIDLEERLSKQYFIRCHKSYLVNAKHIRRLDKTDIELDDGTIIPISRLRVKEVKSILKEFFENRDLI
ncbi:MAG: LytR/AlgR family response regulator transcription factor [Clostridium sp.]|uniref:LytR/AlgR family response regulator transcription factor n=1 Tax=Clostridium sp. TaxID=1506 RepID=UPI003EE48DE7